MNFPTKDLKITYLSESPKGWRTYSVGDDGNIGVIKWHKEKRKVAFFPSYSIILTAPRLKQLLEFILTLN